MKKALEKRQERGQKSLHLYSYCPCPCGCSGCASVPSSDYNNVNNVKASAYGNNDLSAN